MQHKSTFQHVPRQFAVRPLPYRYFVYAYEDVLYTNKLYTAQRALLNELELVEYAWAISAQRCPPAALPTNHPQHLPPVATAVVFRDRSHMLCLLQDGLVFLPSGPLHGSPRDSAAKAWTLHMGTPVRKAVSSALACRMKKPTRFGDTLLFEIVVDDCRNYHEAVHRSFASTGQGGPTVHLTSRALDCPATCVREQRAFFQHLRWQHLQSSSPHRSLVAPITEQHITAGLRVSNTSGTPVVRLSLSLHSDVVAPAGSGSSLSTTEVITSAATAEHTVAEANVVVGKTVDKGQRAALVVYDDCSVYCVTTGKDNCLQFPSGQVEVGREPFEAAIKAFDTFAGPSLRKHAGGVVGLQLMPVSSQRIRAALKDVRELCTQGNTTYFGCRLHGTDLTQLRSSFYSSRRPINGFRMIPTLVKRHPSFLVCYWRHAATMLDPDNDRAVVKFLFGADLKPLAGGAWVASLPSPHEVDILQRARTAAGLDTAEGVEVGSSDPYWRESVAASSVFPFIAASTALAPSSDGAGFRVTLSFRVYSARHVLDMGDVPVPQHRGIAMASKEATVATSVGAFWRRAS